MLCIFHCNFVKVAKKLTERKKEGFRGNVESRARGKGDNEVLSREESLSWLQFVRAN